MSDRDRFNNKYNNGRDYYWDRRSIRGFNKINNTNNSMRTTNVSIEFVSHNIKNKITIYDTVKDYVINYI